MHLDNRGVVLLVLTAAVLVVLAFLLGRWSVDRDAALPAPVPVALGAVPEPSLAPPPDVTQSPPSPVAPTPLPEPGPKAEPRAAGGFFVQVYASGFESKARELQSRLAADGYPAEVSTFTTRGRVYYRVRVGPFRDRASAGAGEKRLRREEGLNTMVVAP